jgi:hypothetical protein
VTAESERIRTEELAAAAAAAAQTIKEQVRRGRFYIP